MTEPADHDLPQNRDHLLDEIPIEVSAELGRVAMTARELAVLSPGAVLRFDRSPGELLDLRVGPKLIGRGELVLVGQELGVLIRETYAEDRADEH